MLQRLLADYFDLQLVRINGILYKWDNIRKWCFWLAFNWKLLIEMEAHLKFINWKFIKWLTAEW